MRCEGIPQGSDLTAPDRVCCPKNSTGKNVVLCQGDMTLCMDCEHVRFPIGSRISQQTRTTNKTRSSTEVIQTMPSRDNTGTSSSSLEAILDPDNRNDSNSFCVHLDEIFQFGYKDINATLLKLEKDELLNIHKELLVKFVDMYPEYKDKKAKHRLVRKNHCTRYIQHWV